MSVFLPNNGSCLMCRDLIQLNRPYTRLLAKQFMQQHSWPDSEDVINLTSVRKKYNELGIMLEKILMDVSQDHWHDAVAQALRDLSRETSHAQRQFSKSSGACNWRSSFNDLPELEPDSATTSHEQVVEEADGATDPQTPRDVPYHIDEDYQYQEDLDLYFQEATDPRNTEQDFMVHLDPNHRFAEQAY